MADTPALEAGGGNPVEVQVLSPAPVRKLQVVEAPRAGEYASNPERKNTPCLSDLAGVDFFLKKERVFFFGVLPSKYSGRWRNTADEVLAKLFFGERICQNFG